MFWQLFICVVILVIGKVATARPTFTANPNNPLIGFQGEAVNFTWEYSNYSINAIHFGVYNKDWNTLENSLIWIKNYKNGTVRPHHDKTSSDTAPYVGRVRWVGDLSQFKVSFELSGLSSADKKTYGIEVDFGDTIASHTELEVKMLSNFTVGAGTLSLQRGQTASFAWRYDLNKDDEKSLSSITFGVYKQGRYKALCVIKVKGRLLESINCSTGVRKPDAHYTVMKATERATFVLSNIDLDDEAVYSIRLGGTLRNMENKTHLIVTDPPKITEQPKSTTIIEGQTLNLTCAAYGKPRLLITWLKDGQVVQENYTERYVVRSIEKKDAGKYQCVAENEVGKETSPIATVDVQYAPIINVSSNIQIVHIPIGRGVRLKCPVTANPEATVEWFANGILEKRGTHELYIFISNTFDYANHTCKASNSIGKDNVTFVLQQVVLSISSPGPLTREVGQDVVFRINGTAMSEATWGVRDGNTNDLNQRLYLAFLPGGASPDTQINSTSYAGRVGFVGDLSKGQAWFKITNLDINDTNQYLAKIILQYESSYRFSATRLTVKPNDPTISTGSARLSPTSTVTQETTFSPSINQPNQEGLSTGAIVGIVIGVIVAVVIIIVIIVVVCRKKKGKKNSTKNTELDALGEFTGLPVHELYHP